ncbi:MAG: Dabb family protein [Lachnospiraceae bacterium]|nr:Dabb family protein [Lachnospiraceae bacterium]
MIRHIVMWNIKEEFTQEEKKKVCEKMAEGFLPLKELVPNVLDLQVEINTMESSNRDFMLLVDFPDEEALKSYQVHPEHVKAASYVKEVTVNRVCFDYAI